MDAPKPAVGTRAREVFLEAIDLPDPAAQAAHLDRVCADDAALRERVEELLRHHREDTFLEKPAVTPPGAPPRTTDESAHAADLAERVGDRIGRYKLLQEIGEGGCGVVYLAEQEEPVRRRVALKIIKLGMDTKAVVARFEAERQALALMDHPHIARIFDGGATRTGRPYFVMELVRGTPITDFCDQNHLTTRERLGLFIQVCQAVQHAHQKGIIHRDLKPSNILVTIHDGLPVPKVIDFGIAKATEQRLTEKTVVTLFHAFVGTPAYTSPEQAESTSLDVDTRSDIYSLGVLLYELLTGRTPFDAKALVASGLEEMRRTILQEEPVRPSARVRNLRPDESTLTARRRQTEPARLAGLLHGDLDWVVMKALEKDRSRRYETASDLALDIQRHLGHEPVLARPPSNGYRLRKLARRHRVAFASGAAFALLLLVGLASTSYQILRKNEAYFWAVNAERAERLMRHKAQSAQARAEAQELHARQQAYAADMNLAQQALATHNLGRAKELLDAQRPRVGWSDLRGWEWRYLRTQCQSDALFTLCQRSNEVTSLAASPDGKWLAMNDFDRQGLSVWDLRSRQEVAHLPAARTRDSMLCAFSPTAPLLAFLSRPDGPRWEGNRRVRFWDAATARFTGEIADVGDCVGLAFSADGQRLLTASTGRSLGLSVWSVPEGQRLQVLPAHELGRGGLFPLLFRASPDLTLAAYVVSGGAAVRVVELATGRELWTAPAAEESVRALAFSPDGKLLASSGGFTESAIRLWDAARGVELGRLEGHRTWVQALVFWPDGKTLASASGDQTVRLWDVASRSPLATFRGHQREVWGLTLLSDGTTLVSGSKDGAVCAWDTTVRRGERAFAIPPLAAHTWCFTPDSQALLVQDRQGQVWRCQGTQFQDAQTLLSSATRCFNSCFSADGQLLAGTAERGMLRVWDLRQGSLLREAYLEARLLAFVPGSHRLLLYRPAGHLYLEWDPEAGREVARWPVPRGFDMRGEAVLSADLRWVFQYGRDGDCRLLERATGQVRSWNLEMKQVSCADFSPDAKRVAVVGVLASGGLWETATGRKEADIHGFLQGLHSVAFSPDGRRLAIGSNGREAVKLMAMESHQELLTLEGRGSMFAGLAFSPDGNLLAACNGQGLLHVWRAPSLEEIERLEASPR